MNRPEVRVHGVGAQFAAARFRERRRTLPGGGVEEGSVLHVVNTHCGTLGQHENYQYVDRNEGEAALRHSLIWRETVGVILLPALILAILAKNRAADDEEIQIGPHETPEGVLRRAYDRLAAYVEAGIDQHRAAGARLER